MAYTRQPRASRGPCSLCRSHSGDAIFAAACRRCREDDGAWYRQPAWTALFGPWQRRACPEPWTLVAEPPKRAWFLPSLVSGPANPVIRRAARARGTSEATARQPAPSQPSFNSGVGAPRPRKPPLIDKVAVFLANGEAQRC